MKTIETQNFLPHSDVEKRNKGIVKYHSQKKAIEVFNQIKEELYKKIDDSTKESIDYLYNELKGDIDIPLGVLVPYSYFDGNEAYRVNVSVIENHEKHTTLFSMKVWGEEDSLKIINALTRILNY